MAPRRKENPWAGVISATIVISIVLYMGSQEFRDLVHMLFYLAVVIAIFWAAYFVWRWYKTNQSIKGESLAVDKGWVEKPRRKTRYSKEKAVDQRENKYNEKEGEKVWVDRSQDIRMRLLEIDWFQFEKLVAMIYESRGYLVKHEGGAKPDEGIDLLVDSKEGPFVVQCKHWRKKDISVKEIRELLGTMVDQGIPHGVFVTMHGYTKPAKDLADRNNVILCDAKYLESLINSSAAKDKLKMLELLYSTEKECPRCRNMMVNESYTSSRRTLHRWRCPSCRYVLKT